MVYTDEDWQKIAGANSEFIHADDVMGAIGDGERVYGLWNGQIVAVKSAYMLERYADSERFWISRTTIADMIGRA